VSEAAGGVLVAGEINTDLVGRVARAPEAGETVSGSAFAVFGGGKGANQAVACARSGAATAMLGAVGDDDFGRQRLDDLRADGIDTGAVDVTQEAASGVALIVVEEASGQNRITYIPGANLTVGPDAATAAVEATHPTVVLATLALPEPTRGALFQAARERGTTVVLNATPEPLGARAHLDQIDVLIANETEAGDLLGRPVEGGGAAEAAAALAALGPAVVALTLGAAGALILTDGVATPLPAPPVEVVDTTGAGDAFCGAFAARLAAGADPVAAARAGVAAGSLACTRAGAQPSMPRAEEIAAVLWDRT
jgi:ribokinase